MLTRDMGALLCCRLFQQSSCMSLYTAVASVGGAAHRIPSDGLTPRTDNARAAVIPVIPLLGGVARSDGVVAA